MECYLYLGNDDDDDCRNTKTHAQIKSTEYNSLYKYAKLRRKKTKHTTKLSLLQIMLAYSHVADKHMQMDRNGTSLTDKKLVTFQNTLTETAFRSSGCRLLHTMLFGLTKPVTEI